MPTAAICQVWIFLLVGRVRQTVSSFTVASPGPFGPSIIDREMLWLNVTRSNLKIALSYSSRLMGDFRISRAVRPTPAGEHMN